MKHITKGREPAELTAWKALENEDWSPTYDGLSGAEKRAVKRALMQEQGYICCYCERRLTEHDSHIEHFKPQSDEAVDPLDYSNLLCSCQNQLEKGEPRHCGNLKGDWFDERLLVSPMEPECEQRFQFTWDGNIYPAPGDGAAGVTITKLGLDLPKLVSMRAAAIEPFLNEELSDDELALFIDGYLQQGETGQYSPFWTMIYSLFTGLTPNTQA